jgi:ABC-2 type transport system permease protein
MAKAGTLPWLLRYELRLWWRELRGKWFVFLLLGLFGLLLAASITPLMVLSVATGRPLPMMGEIPQPLFWVAVVFWFLGLFYSFTQAMGQSVITLFDRGDLDLLVSSPVSSQVVFASRLLAIALQSFFSFSLFVIPASLIVVLLGLPQLLGIFPALLALCLVSASLSMLLTLALVRLMGAPRARVFAQLLNLLLSALFFLGLQLPNLLLHSGNHPLGVWRQVEGWFAEGSPLSASSLLWFPVRAMFFDVPALLLTFLVSGGLAWLTVETLHRSFLHGTQQSLTLKRHTTIAPVRFQSGLNRIVLQKEWRIIRRNPYLISQTFLSFIFLIPLLAIVLRNQTVAGLPSLSVAVATALPLMGSSLVSALTVIATSGEEAPDLLRSSPARGDRLRWLKLLAALIPVWLLVLPVFLVLLLRGDAWFPPLLAFLGATLCTALLRLWNARPISLAGVIKRQKQNASNDLLLVSLESLSIYLWAGFGYLLTQGNWLGSGWVLGLIALVVAIAYLRSRSLGSSLGF